jgi:hypothetical protein
MDPTYTIRLHVKNGDGEIDRKKKVSSLTGAYFTEHLRAKKIPLGICSIELGERLMQDLGFESTINMCLTKSNNKTVKYYVSVELEAEEQQQTANQQITYEVF